jgi:Ca2+-binding EF-hand superfamily protein
LATLLKLELSLAGKIELLKQDLSSQFDYNVDLLYKEVDDCNLKFIDQVALRRYLAKCGIVCSLNRVMAIIRRWDLNANAKLNITEFYEGVTP